MSNSNGNFFINAFKCTNFYKYDIINTIMKQRLTSLSDMYLLYRCEVSR